MFNLAYETAGQSSHVELWIGEGILDDFSRLVPLADYSKTVIVADAGAQKWSDRLVEHTGTEATSLRSIAGGDGCKDPHHLQVLWEFFLRQGLDRRSLVVAIGGGAACDLVGFAASSYMRGISVINVPTTLLAQVDASIGGKNGINFGGIKNLLGTFSQPRGVIIDTQTLETLSERERRSGFAEIIKHGLIKDARYFDEVTSKDCLLWTGTALARLVHRSCEIKRDVVLEDEFETGPRKTLNFGHTIGHAIEASSYETATPLAHGEAVAIGMAAAAFLSFRSGRLSQDTYLEIVNRIERSGLPIRLPYHLDSEHVFSLLAQDKKSVGGRARWTLLTGIGSAEFGIELEEEIIREVITLIQPKMP